MSRRARSSSLGRWVGSLSTWKLVTGFVAAALAIGSAVVASFSGLERQYGILANQMGWARTVDVGSAVENLKEWQLYSDIRRLKREIYDLGQPADDRERERFDDLTTQLAATQAEYTRIHTKARNGS